MSELNLTIPPLPVSHHRLSATRKTTLAPLPRGPVGLCIVASFTEQPVQRVLLRWLSHCLFAIAGLHMSPADGFGHLLATLLLASAAGTQATSAWTATGHAVGSSEQRRREVLRPWRAAGNCNGWNMMVPAFASAAAASAGRWKRNRGGCWRRAAGTRRGHALSSVVHSGHASECWCCCCGYRAAPSLPTTAICICSRLCREFNGCAVARCT